MGLEQLVKELSIKLKGNIKLNEPMKKHTSWKIGGPADVMVLPRDTEDVCQTILSCKQHHIPWWVLGNGSNLLILDGGIRGVVIKIAGNLNKCEWLENGVVTGAGVTLPRLAKETVNRGLVGLELCAGIPASAGGAVVMNAGIGVSSFGDFVQSVEVVDEKGIPYFLGSKELSFGYRYSALQNKDCIVTRVSLVLSLGNKEEGERKIKDSWEKRRRSQPLDYPNAGSVFKNPQGDYAGRLIESIGGKGLRYGSAQVSTKHANFIINLGGATAADVLCLMEDIKAKVWRDFSIELEPEVHIVGETR